MADMALTAPYADCCERCGQRAWPHAVDRQGGWLNGKYRCLGCEHVWTCGYAVDAPYYLNA
jgi:ribosomal protein L32